MGSIREETSSAAAKYAGSSVLSPSKALPLIFSRKSINGQLSTFGDMPTFLENEGTALHFFVKDER